MPGVPASNVLQSLSWRAAIKNFDPARKIPPETWSSLEKAAILAPSSYGLQPWRFVVVTDPKVRERLRTHSWNQSQITDSSHLVVFARRTTMSEKDVDRLIERTVAVRGVSRESLEGYRQMMLGTVNDPSQRERLSDWNARQVYIALGFFLAAAAMVGVDACPMEGFEAHKYDEVLGLAEQGYSATVLATAGYRAADDPYTKMPKVRFPVDQVVRHI